MPIVLVVACRWCWTSQLFIPCAKVEAILRKMWVSVCERATHVVGVEWSNCKSETRRTSMQDDRRRPFHMKNASWMTSTSSVKKEQKKRTQRDGSLAHLLTSMVCLHLHGLILMSSSLIITYPDMRKKTPSLCGAQLGPPPSITTNIQAIVILCNCVLQRIAFLSCVVSDLCLRENIVNN